MKKALEITTEVRQTRDVSLVKKISNFGNQIKQGHNKNHVGMGYHCTAG